VLRPTDQAALDELERRYEVGHDGAFLTIIINEFPMPRGLDPTMSGLLLRLPPGFPDATPDMFWLDPPVHRQGGVAIPGTEARELYLGRTWQRWSRHIQGQWRPGVDNLATYLAYVRRCLDQAAGRAA
jgi:hypothetical protein